MVEIVTKNGDFHPKPKTKYYLAWSFDISDNIDYNVLSDSVEELCQYILEQYKGQFTNNKGKLFHERYVAVCEVCPPDPPSENPNAWDGNPVVIFGLR